MGPSERHGGAGCAATSPPDRRGAVRAGLARRDVRVECGVVLEGLDSADPLPGEDADIGRPVSLSARQAMESASRLLRAANVPDQRPDVALVARSFQEECGDDGRPDEGQARQSPHRDSFPGTAGRRAVADDDSAWHAVPSTPSHGAGLWSALGDPSIGQMAYLLGDPAWSSGASRPGGA